MFRALLCPSSGASILPAFAASGENKRVFLKAFKTGASCWILFTVVIDDARNHEPESYSTSTPLNVSPEKSQILSCDTVVANERYMEELTEVFHVE
jgi:hypothetical protein